MGIIIQRIFDTPVDLLSLFLFHLFLYPYAEVKEVLQFPKY